MVQKVHCLSTNYQNNKVESLNSTSVQSLVHKGIELQTHACPILMYGLKLVFLVVFQKRDAYTNCTMPIFCVSPITVTSPSFRCWSIPVSEIREFNRKKKKEKKMNNPAIFNSSPLSKWNHFYLVFDGIVTMMSLEIQFLNVHA